MTNFSPYLPIFVGFSGPAGCGKTETAKKIVPSGSFTISAGTDFSMSAPPSIHWDHYWFSMPLYDFFTTRTELIGDDTKDRMLYRIHETANMLMTQNISYDNLIELVYDIYSFPIDSTELDKPRTFLQGVGDLCRAHYNECFSNALYYKVINFYYGVMKEYDEEPPLYIPIVSDVRMPWEAKMITDQKNHLMIKFICSPEVLKERLYNRDGHTLTSEQNAHDTENYYDVIPAEDFDLVIDTTDMTLAEQTQIVYNYITQSIQLEKVLNAHG